MKLQNILTPSITIMIMLSGIAVAQDRPATIVFDQETASEFLRTLERNIADDGSVQFGEITINNNEFTVSQININYEDDVLPVSGEIHFSDIYKTQDGYLIGQIIADKLSITSQSDDTSASLENLAVYNYEMSEDGLFNTGFMSIGKTTIKSDGVEVFSFDGGDTTTEISLIDGISYLVENSNIYGGLIDLTPLGNGKEDFDKSIYGLSKIPFEIQSFSKWDVDSGDIDGAVSLSLLGNLSTTIDFEIGNVTQDFVRDVRNTEDIDAKLEKIGEAELKSITAYIEDDSLIARVLNDETSDYKMTISILAMAYLKGDEDKRRIWKSIESFLDNPENLTISIIPDKPTMIKNIENFTMDWLNVRSND